MLKHEDNLQTASPPAAQVRVTPEELAAAITALQIRKEGQPGTIAIGEAVDELGLDVTPEEVLAEVLSGRIQPKRRLDYRALVCAIACMALPGSIFLVFSMLPQPTLSSSDTSYAKPVSVAEPPTITSSTIAPPFAPDNPLHNIQIDLTHLQVRDLSGELVLISEVRNGHPVLCSYYAGAFQNYSSFAADSAWTLIKHGDRWYVRGWIPHVSRKLVLTNGAEVSTRKSTRFAVPVALPIRGFRITPSDDIPTQFHAVDVHLDNHAYEKW